MIDCKLELDSGYGAGITIHKDGHTIEISFYDYGEVTISIDGKSLHVRDNVTAFFEAINNWDINKLEFMKKLAESGLNADKFADFDIKKLQRCIKSRNTIKEMINMVYDIFSEEKPVKAGNLLIIPIDLYTESFVDNSAKVMIKTLTSDPKYYYGKINPLRLAKIIRKGKLTKDDISKLKTISAKEFAEVLRYVDIDGFEQYLPEYMMF